MPARSISTASLTFGLVSIPVRLFPATSSKSVSFHLLHAKDMSRIQQKIYCPKEDKIVDRSELVRGYEIEKDRYVTFTDDELKKLEAQADRAVEITGFIPASEVDPVYFENSYLLGCEPTSAKAYRLLQEAMTKAERVGVAKYTMRGKERVVLIRPYEGAFGEIDHGANAQVKESELSLAQRLLDDLTQKKFNPSEFKDNYRERVIEAAEQKMAGNELTEPAPEVKQGKVIDLMSALKESLKKRGVGVNEDREQAAPAERGEQRKVAHESRREPRTRRAR
jgi:DNA end-binding protein Ku